MNLLLVKIHIGLIFPEINKAALVLPPVLRGLAMRRIPWYKRWRICVVGREEPLSGVVRRAGCQPPIPPEMAVLFHHPMRSHHLHQSLLNLTTETRLSSLLVLIQRRKLPPRAQRHLFHRLPISCNRLHRHRRLLWTLSSIRTSKVSQASAAAGLTAVVRALMHRSPRRRHHRVRDLDKEII
jgi:hypothetical protein